MVTVRLDENQTRYETTSVPDPKHKMAASCMRYYIDKCQRKAYLDKE